MKAKAIQDEMGEVFDEYGTTRSWAWQVPATNAMNQNFVLQNFLDPPTEVITDSLEPLTPVQGDGTQIWKITRQRRGHAPSALPFV